MASRRIIGKGTSTAAELLLRRPQSYTIGQSFNIFTRTASSGSIGSTVEALRRPQLQQQAAKETTSVSTVKQSQSSPLSKVHFSSVAYGAAAVAKQVENEITSDDDGVLSAGISNWTLLHEETFANVKAPDNIVLFADDALILSQTKDIEEVEVFYQSKNLNTSRRLESAPSSLRAAARLPDDGGLVLCGRRELVFYDSNCEYVSSNKLSSGCRPNAMTVDTNGNVILAMMDTKTIAIYDREGKFQNLFHTESSPRSLAMTSEGRLVTSFVDGTLQIMPLFPDSSTEATRQISPPPGVHQWQPTGVCCSDNGDLFVVDWSRGSVHRYTDNGHHLDMVCEGLRDPQQIAVSANADVLHVLESGLSHALELFAGGPFLSKGPCVKTFNLDK